MEKRRLGRTNFMVSCIGLGGMRLTSRFGVGVTESFNIIGTALRGGINFIDIARSYYDSEQVVGRALSRDGNDKVYLATKSFMRSASELKKEIEQSLKDLNVARIDLYQVHHIQYEYELREILYSGGVMDALREAQKNGKIGYIGFSAHNPQVAIECIRTGEFDTAQIPFNPIEKEYIDEIIAEAKRHDVGIIAMKPFAGGKLRNTALALKFILSYEEVACVIPGAGSVREIAQDIALGESDLALTASERKELFKEIESLPDNFCRRCRYCEKVCPSNIPIPDVFRCEEHILYNATYARNEYKKFQDEVRRCTECGACEKMCPYNLPIVEMLKDADRRLRKGRIEDLTVNLLRRLHLYDWVRKVYFDLNLPLPKR